AGNPDSGYNRRWCEWICYPQFQYEGFAMLPVAFATASRISIRSLFQRSAALMPVLLLLATIVCRGDEAPGEKKPEAPGQTKVGWKELFDGKTLKGWTVSEFGGQGEVNVEEGHITLGQADGCTGVTLK